MGTRGIRGATTVLNDDAEEIILATRDLLNEILEANPTCKVEDIASAIFTVSVDISSVYPAKAARELGWDKVPLLCAQEIPIPNGLSHCIRILIHWNTDIEQKAIRHIYLRKAATLRPSLSAS